MKLSEQAVEDILHVISTFDRERGIPHDYHDLAVVLRNTHFERNFGGDLEIDAAKLPRPARRDTELDDSVEAKAKLLEAARSWLE